MLSLKGWGKEDGSNVLNETLYTNKPISIKSI